ncbi:hypothetical protein [Streptomyces sp. NPDC048669]|uniref:hypothetical protein n=1 Tax=Streptomyces sp. NPDC048669 TaxID=3155267 RepID=UPI0034355664
MNDVERLVEAFEEMRKKEGVTTSKLRARLWLLELLGAPDDPESGLKKLDQLLKSMGDNPTGRAARNALNIGMEWRGELDERREWARGIGLPKEKRFLDRSRGTHIAFEKRAFPELARLILEETNKSEKQDTASTDLVLGLETEFFTDGDATELPRPEAEIPFTRPSLWRRIVANQNLLLSALVILSLCAGFAIARDIYAKPGAPKDNYGRLSPKESGHYISSLYKPPAAVTTQPTSDDTRGWGPQRTTFTMKKPAPYAVFNSITDHPLHGDERNFTQCRDKQGGDWTTEARAQEGHVYQCYIWFANSVAPNVSDGNPAATLHDARARVRLPDHEADSPSLVGYLSAANAATVWSSCRFNSDQRVTITYQRRTASIQPVPYDADRRPIAETYNGDTATGGLASSSGALLGRTKLDGVLGQEAGYVQFDVKVTLD